MNQITWQVAIDDSWSWHCVMDSISAWQLKITYLSERSWIIFHQKCSCRSQSHNVPFFPVGRATKPVQSLIERFRISKLRFFWCPVCLTLQTKKKTVAAETRAGWYWWPTSEFVAENIGRTQDLSFNAYPAEFHAVNSLKSEKKSQKHRTKYALSRSPTTNRKQSRESSSGEQILTALSVVCSLTLPNCMAMIQ